MIAQPWVWLAAALVLAIGEVLIPGYVLLGFAIGAAILAAFLWVGGPLAAGMAASVPLLLAAFAVISLIAWLLLRRFLGVFRGQVKTFDRDINDE